MGKRDNRYAYMNPIVAARAAYKPPSGPSIRDYLNRDRPSWEEVKDIMQKKKKECSTLAAWEDRMNEKFREDLKKNRERLLGEGTSNNSVESSEQKKTPRKRKHSRSRSPSNTLSSSSSSSSEKPEEKLHKKRRKHKHKEDSDSHERKRKKKHKKDKKNKKQKKKKKRRREESKE